MGKYAKQFETENQYSAFTRSADYILPNVSYVTETDNVYYNPMEDPIVVVRYNVTTTSEAATLFDLSSSSNIAKMVIDGVEQPTVEYEYMFNTTGQHVVEYLLSSTSIDGNMFSNVCYNCDILSLDISNGVTYIGNYAFNGCSALTTIYIPNSVTYLGNYAFYECSSLTSAVIGAGVTGGSEYLFDGCTSLTSITINSNITNKQLIDA